MLPSYLWSLRKSPSPREPSKLPSLRGYVPEQRRATDYGSPPHGVPSGGLDPNALVLPSSQRHPAPGGPCPPKGISGGVIGGVIALLLTMGGIIGAFAACSGLPGIGSSGSATATQTQATATARAQSNTTATAQAQASATAQAQGTATAQASATVQAVNATATATPCQYMYWKTGPATGPPRDKTLTNFVVPQGCVLVLDSESGQLQSGSSKPANWSMGGVMAFSPGIYSGDIYNGEYEIVPERANPNPEQVFCNSVQQVVTNHSAFSQAQPLPAWVLPSGNLPPGPQIVAQRHC